MMTNNLKNTVMISLGSGFEYYDFIIYGMMANYLSHAFFDQSTQSLALVKTFTLFAIAYFVRPLGGMVFGHFGDKKGRKTSFNWSIGLMALATVSIGFLPSYEKAGSIGAYCLLVLRIIQGVAQGAELPGAITLICESTHKRQGLYSALLFSFIGLGAALAAFVVYVLNVLLTQDQMQDFGWRIPFILGALLALIAIWCRKNASESQAFKNAPKLNFPLKALITNPMQIVNAIGVTMLAAVLIVFKLYFPKLFNQYYHYQMKDIYLTLSISLVFSSIIHPVIGFLSDYVKREALLYISGLVIAFIMPLLFAFVAKTSFGHLLTFMLLYQVMISLLVVCYPPLLASAFETSVRYTGVALCYNLSYSLASLSPVLTDTILNQGVNPVVIYLSLSGFALVNVLYLFKNFNVNQFETR